MQKIQGDLCHKTLTAIEKPSLSYTDGADFSVWKNQIQERFFDLTGLTKIPRNACPLNVQVESETQKDGYKQIRFVFESEKDAFVPCYLLIPDTGKEKYPVAITLQGHSSGFHNSIGEPKSDKEEDQIEWRKQFAVQAVKRGFIALAIEQRGMGERRPNGALQSMASMCEYEAHIAFLLGRTLAGERAWDVSKAIDALSFFPQCDTEKILITGNSGGGTASFYSACFDKRIKLCVPSCSFCSYETSIMSIYHCACNFIPRAYEYFEMQDLSCLIAPRPLAIVAGEKDHIFPIDGVRKGFETVQAVYALAGAEANCRLVETPMAHWWCEDIVWETIAQETQKLGWTVE